MNKFILFLKGVLMGACDVIPGVSGGTIAFITGIYDKLIDSLHSINFKTLKILLQGKLKLFRKTINGSFLLTIFSGIIVSILSFVKIINYLLINYPILLRAFFFGLILASAFILRKSIKKRHKKYIILGIVGVLIGFLITALPIIQSGQGNMFVFLSGFIAIIAMILPGISGSYILVILGQYQNIIGNVINSMGGDIKSIISILIFIIGAVIGLLSFSKLLYYIKTRWHDQMVIVLIGFMVGSLNKVRPWKKTIEIFTDRHGDVHPLIQKNISPSDINSIFLALGLAIFGFLIVYLIHFGVKKISHSNKN